jgi:hypothetical protein
MTLSEFKAWFEGFTESMDGPPSLKQWERIQARVKEISGVPVTQTVFVDRYLPAYRDVWRGPYIAYAATQSVQNTDLNVAGFSDGSIGHNTALNGAGQMQAFDSHSAMADLGRADADALKAA